LELVLRRVHPNEEPEIIVVAVTHGNQKYLVWIFQESTGKTPSEK
jgi:uncharacterized protein involved in tolerance to divalent cations